MIKIILFAMILPCLSFAKETSDRKPANARGPSYSTGTSLSYRLPQQTDVRLVAFSGESARAVWRTLTVRQYSLGEEDGTETYQKVGSNITCERTHYKSESRHEYTCSIMIDKDGKTLSGAAG